MKTRFPSELLCASGIVIAAASVFGLAFFDRSEWINAALGLIGIPVAGGLLVAVLDMIFERKTPVVREEKQYFSRPAVSQRVRKTTVIAVAGAARRRVVALSQVRTPQLQRCA